MGMFGRLVLGGAVKTAAMGVGLWRNVAEGTLIPGTISKNYSEGDVAEMKKAARAAVGAVDEQVRALDELIPRDIAPKTLDQVTKSYAGYMVKLDAKYRDIPHGVLRTRVKESLVAGYLEKHHSDQELRA